MISTSCLSEKKRAVAREGNKTFTPNEIRKMLVTKLPQLKSNILMLDDGQIEKIFYEGIQNEK
jgi:hypothetical protein